MSEKRSEKVPPERSVMRSYSRRRFKPKSILKGTKAVRQTLYPVYYEGQNVTPKPLNPLAYREGKERPISVQNIVDMPPQTMTTGSSKSAASVFGSFSEVSSKIHTETLLNLGSAAGGYGSTNFDLTVIERVVDNETASLGGSESSDLISYQEPPVPAMPSRISLTLVETPTYFIFELASSTAVKGTEEADTVENDNEIYQFLTVGKGRYRKVVNAEAQTAPILKKTRDTVTARRKTKNDYSYVSAWDMFDTYSSVAEAEAKKDEDVVVIGDVQQASIDSFQVPSEEKQMMKLVRTTEFLDALCVIERLLANNNFNEQQKKFRGLCEPDPFRKEIDYKYRLNLLWTFANAKTEKRCVSKMCWNPANEDVLAVAYGKFYYAEDTTGMVMIWNVKNPVQPERTYEFPEPVTAIDFSTQHPNLLAVGFYTGLIKILDVSDHQEKVLSVTNRDDSPLFEPIWQLFWYTDHDYYKGTEFIMAASQDGRLSRFLFDQSAYIPHFHLMRVSRAEGKLKGLKTDRKCVVPGIPIARHPAALVIAQHPDDPNIYYVGTSEGVVHKCSKNYFHQHLDLFLAHEGPTYQLKFSPFCNKLFLSCGDDWVVRIWAETISDPLLELSKTMNTVQDADWSPAHSTIIASVTSSDVYVWDLQRKAYAPQSVAKVPSKARCTAVQFTRNGRCLCVADIVGNVHIFSLEDMPFSPFYQDQLLTTSLKRELVIKPDLLKKVVKLGRLSFEKNRPKQHFQ